MPKKIARSDELCNKPAIREQLEKVFRQAEKAIMDQVERSDRNVDYWDMWNCKLGTNQKYAGNSQVFIPLVRNATKALRTRYVNALFPQTGRNVAVISHDDESPDRQVALQEHYIRRAKLRSEVIPPLMVCGIIEGQMTLCVTWGKRSRTVVDRIPQPLRVYGMDMPEEMGSVATTEEKEIFDEGPDVEVILDSDFAIFPATANSIAAALEEGGGAVALRRWDKHKLEELKDEGELDIDSVDELLAEMKQMESNKEQSKKNLHAAGIKGVGEYALVYRAWCKIEVEKKKRLALVYFVGEQKILSCKLCPYWLDKPDYITHARDRLPGNAKGMSQISPGVYDMQIAANDAINEGLDQLTYNLLPPIRYDPEKVQPDTLIMDLMALWPAPPGSLEQIQFRDTWEQAVSAVAAAERYINQSLGVSPAALPQSTGARQKRNQAEIAQEQRIDILSTDDATYETEESLMNEVVERFAAYDLQFREREVTVQEFGQFGIKLQMTDVPVQQIGKRWKYVWYGVEASRTVQQVQQMIAAANVLQPMSQHPSVALAGKRVNMVPIIQVLVESAFPARLGPRIFEDMAEMFSIPADLENQMMSLGQEAFVSPMDNDAEHLQKHTQAMQGQPPGSPAFVQFTRHIAHHQAGMQIKANAQMQKAMQAQMQGGARGGGGAGGRNPNRPPRPPQPGAQPAMPRQGRQPPGALHPDQMTKSGVIQMPRRVG